MPNGAADRSLAVDLQCCRSSSATSRPVPMRQRLVLRTVLSPLAHRTHENNRGRTQTGTVRLAVARRESPIQRSGSAERVPPFWPVLSRLRAVQHLPRVHRSSVPPTKLNSCQYQRRSRRDRVRSDELDKQRLWLPGVPRHLSRSVTLIP